MNTQIQSQQIEPLPEGWYRAATLSSPRIELQGDWFIAGNSLATADVGATAGLGYVGEWLILRYHGDAEVCQQLECVTLSAVEWDEAALRNEDESAEVTIQNIAEFQLDRLVVLSGDRANIAYVPYVMAPSVPTVDVGPGRVSLEFSAGEILLSMLLMSSLVMLGALLAVGVYRWK